LDPFVAEIRIFAGNFAPKGWALCDGQILPISQNTALFSLLGTTYGGDGKSNFALPNLQGAAPMHPGQGPGLSLHDLGESGGTQGVTLLQTEIPGHTHGVQAKATAGNQDTPNNALWASAASGRQTVPMYAASSGATIGNLDPSALGITGGNLPHNNLQPYLGLTFIIALQGVFPPRT
jgi:microcystin-dependent protein